MPFTKDKIQKFHFDEIQLILFIGATDLSKYDDDNLISFTECIEGRIEVLLQPEYIKSLNKLIFIEDEIIEVFKKLADNYIKIYSKQWHKKMRNLNDWSTVHSLSIEILQKLNIKYQEPQHFMDNNFDI